MIAVFRTKTFILLSSIAIFNVMGHGPQLELQLPAGADLQTNTGIDPDICFMSCDEFGC